MDAKGSRNAGGVVLCLVLWLVLAYAQIAVIGMSLTAWYLHERGADPSPIVGRIWAMAWPVQFLANAAVLLWRNPPEALAVLGRVFLLLPCLIVAVLVGGFLFN